MRRLGKHIGSILLLYMILATGCGGGMYATGNPKTDTSYTTPWGNVTITKDAFIFGSDYPAKIVIPDIDGMRDTAFVVSLSAPTGLLAIDLESDPLTLSPEFVGLISPDNTGVPKGLFISGIDRAFLLTTSHVIDFNPTTGTVNRALYLLETHTLDQYLPLSAPADIDDDGIEETTTKTIEMVVGEGLAVAGNKLYITMTNYISYSPPVTAPGLVRIFVVEDTSPYLRETEKTPVTSDFNPTGITPINGNLLAITNTGVLGIQDGAGYPLTKSSIDILDTETDEIVNNILFGYVATSFQEMVVTADGRTAYMGSATFGEVYSIDLDRMVAVHSHADPITITGNTMGGDYLVSLTKSFDDRYLFTASFDNSTIYPVDIGESGPTVLPDAFPEPFVIGFPKGVSAENPTGTNTGIGGIATRPGAPGIDYTGPDLFAITCFPGTLVTINTHGTGLNQKLQIDSLEIVPEHLEITEGDDPVQLYLTIELADDTIMEEITDTFTNPMSGYPTSVRWHSSNSQVLSINSAAQLTPIADGEATITASIGQKSATANVIIKSAPQSSLAINDELNTQEEEEPDIQQEKDIVILTEAPEGTDAFADAVVEFSPGRWSGFGSTSMPDIVLGPPKGRGAMAGSTDVLSLGHEGEIILEVSDFIIADGEGPDLTVFENAFFAGGNPEAPFSEPGIVSVSEDGEEFYEFSCELDNSPHYPGCAGTKPTLSNPDNGIDPTDPEVSGGNQFDLAEVGLPTARFVKIVDGGEGWGGGNTAGFDLDAIAVINGTLPQ